MMNNWFISVNPFQFGELKVWFAPTPPNLRLQSTVKLHLTSFLYFSWSFLIDPLLTVSIANSIKYFARTLDRHTLPKSKDPGVFNKCRSNNQDYCPNHWKVTQSWPIMATFGNYEKYKFKASRTSNPVLLKKREALWMKIQPHELTNFINKKLRNVCKIKRP